jgi:hypothetical protein
LNQRNLDNRISKLEGQNTQPDTKALEIIEILRRLERGDLGELSSEEQIIKELMQIQSGDKFVKKTRKKNR